mmetsp:Transcript_43139/g.91972  ORF Transcript_43139/g.91972 Transcript_43139/m.91972 type:complete len:201 (+) Transcript_43139:879-1481(+)
MHQDLPTPPAHLRPHPGKGDLDLRRSPLEVAQDAKENLGADHFLELAHQLQWQILREQAALVQPLDALLHSFFLHYLALPRSLALLGLRLTLCACRRRFAICPLQLPRLAVALTHGFPRANLDALWQLAPLILLDLLLPFVCALGLGIGGCRLSLGNCHLLAHESNGVLYTGSGLMQSIQHAEGHLLIQPRERSCHSAQA